MDLSSSIKSPSSTTTTTTNTTASTSSALNMSLDDIIKSRKKENRQDSRQRPQKPTLTNRDTRDSRRDSSHRGSRDRRRQQTPIRKPYSHATRPSRYQEHRHHSRSDTSSHSSPIGGSLVVSNLNPNATRAELETLFSRIGPLHYPNGIIMNFDQSGRSDGSAQIHFKYRQDAYQAMDRFQHIPFEGYPMNLKLVSSSPHRTQPKSEPIRKDNDYMME